MNATLKIGDGVQWYDNGLRFGWLKQLGYKWARVQHPVWGKVKVKAEDLIKYEVKNDGQKTKRRAAN